MVTETGFQPWPIYADIRGRHAIAGALTSTGRAGSDAGEALADRRGEAHLWLLFEETLADVVRQGRAGQGPARRQRAWESRRNYGYVAGALAAAGTVSVPVAAALLRELDDALVLRGLVELDHFGGRAFPVEQAATPPPAPAGGPQVWLEAEIERHLDLLGSMAPGERPEAGGEVLRILSGPIRAFAAAGAGEPCARLVEQLAASLDAAGFDVGDLVTDPLVARPEWVRFLHERPIPRPASGPVAHRRELREAMGRLGGHQVVLAGLGWSPDRLDVSMLVRPPRGGEADHGSQGLRVRALDDEGRLHLGQVGEISAAGEVLVHLRPGLGPAAASLQLRVTAGGECLSTGLVL